MEAQATRVDVMYAYFDYENLPRAYAMGPSDEEGSVMRVAEEMLKEYISTKRHWYIGREDFKLRRRFIKRAEDGAIVEEGEWEDM